MMFSDKIAMDLLDGVETMQDFFEHFKWPHDERHVARAQEIMDWKRDVLEQWQQEWMEEMKNDGD